MIPGQQAEQLTLPALAAGAGELHVGPDPLEQLTQPSVSFTEPVLLVARARQHKILNEVGHCKQLTRYFIVCGISRSDTSYFRAKGVFHKYKEIGASGLLRTAGSDSFHLCRISQDLLDCRGDFQKHLALLLAAVIQKILHIAEKGVCLRGLIAPQERVHRHIQRSRQPQEGAEAGLPA